MKKLFPILTVFFFFQISSCSKSTGISKDIIPELIEWKKTKNKIIYQEIKLKCTGTEYDYSKCFSNPEKTAILFETENIKFEIENKKFNHYPINFSAELGYEVKLFTFRNTKIIILNSFLENGNDLDVYIYQEHQLKYLGHRELVVSDENRKMIWRVEQSGKNLVLDTGKSNVALKFDLNSAILL